MTDAENPTCDVCGESFADRDRLVDHLTDVHDVFSRTAVGWSA